MKPSFCEEENYWKRGYQHVAGLDEAGRGCLAGPVIAAAVILPQDADLPGLNDSKRLTPVQRDRLFTLIEGEALAIGIGQCSPKEIDEDNILQASLEAMRRAVSDLSITPHALLVDGNQYIKNVQIEQDFVIKGDSISLSIAAASVVAKVTRDRQMVNLHAQFPQYGWSRHKGYPTQAHYEAIATHGPSPHHRRSFKLFR